MTAWTRLKLKPARLNLSVPNFKRFYTKEMTEIKILARKLSFSFYCHALIIEFKTFLRLFFCVFHFVI
jgi:hypothetical protein